MNRILKFDCVVRRNAFLALREFSSADLPKLLKERIDKYLREDPVVVFMKGTQAEPQCGFSRNVKIILDFHNIKFKSYNVLEDQELREGIKKFSDWPTIPQVYVNGKFVGGSDILVQMHNEGEITDYFENEGIKSKFSDSKQDKKR